MAKGRRARLFKAAVLFDVWMRRPHPFLHRVGQLLDALSALQR
jgi:hypothetical protein